MVSGRASNGRGGGQIGHGAARDDDKRKKICSDAARLRGSYRYTKYGLTPPPAFSRREASSASRRTASASSSSRAPVVKMDVDDNVEDEVPGFAPGDFVDDTHLPTVIALVSENSRRDADKKEEWHRVVEEQGKVYIDLDTDEEE